MTENKSKNIVKITEKGRKITKEFIKIIDEIENEVFKDFNNDEKEDLKIILRDLSKKYYNLN